MRGEEIKREAEMWKWKERGGMLKKENIGQANPYCCVSNSVCSPVHGILLDGRQVYLGRERHHETANQSCDGEGNSERILL